MKYGAGLLVALVAACLPPVEDVGAGPSAPASEASSGVAAATTSVASTTSGGPGASPTTGGDTSTTSTGGTFIVYYDLPPELVDNCDVYAQDCPADQKCVWSDNGDGFFPEHMICVPLAADPLPNGSPCKYDVDNPFFGIDDCGPAAMCVEGYFTDGEYDGIGTCTSLCLGSDYYSYCEPGYACVGGRVFYLCQPMCDPLAQDCPAGSRCDTYGPVTFCMAESPAPQHLPAGEPCSNQDDCAPGTTCSGDAIQGCEACCTPFCDRDDPQFMCPFAGQTCRELYEDWEPVDVGPLGMCRQEPP